MNAIRYYTREETKRIGTEAGIFSENCDLEEFQRGLNLEIARMQGDKRDIHCLARLVMVHLQFFPEYYRQLGQVWSRLHDTSPTTPA